MKWFEYFKNQCPKCKKYLAFYLKKEGRKYYYFRCKFCGFKRRKLILWAEYKHKNGKTYLRTQDWKDYREVELVKNRGRGFKVKEVNKQRPLANII